MKKLFCAISLLSALTLQAKEIPYVYTFFDNSLTPKDYFYSVAEYSSPSWVKNSGGKLPISTEKFFTAGNSLELTYLSEKGGEWSSEVLYHQIRGNNFFVDSEVLSFNVNFQKDMPKNALPKVAIRMADGTISKSVAIADYLNSSPHKGWKTVAIPLSKLGIEEITDSNILELKAVRFSPNATDNTVHTIYIDDIEILPYSLNAAAKLTAPDLLEAKAYERHIDLKWEKMDEADVKYYVVYRSEDGKNFEKVATCKPWMARYTDFLGDVNRTAHYKVSAVDFTLKESKPSEILSATTYPMTDEQLLDMVQEAHLRYYWEGGEEASGLALENIPGRRDMIALGASGFGIMAMISGIERGFISHDEGVDRFVKIVEFLDRADRYHGVFAHFIDGKTAKTEPFFGTRDNGGDLVECAFIFQGLIAARQYFDGDSAKEQQIRETIDKLWREVEWDWYKKTEDSEFLYWHWSPDQAWVINHRLIGWNEAMIVYLLGIMAPEYSISPEMYYSGWANQGEIGQDYRRAWGQTDDGKHYTNGNTYYGIKLDVAVSNGGPLFFTHYSYMGFDPHKLTDRYTNYFDNNRNIALINYNYCVENPGGYIGYGADFWGLTACDNDWKYQAHEPVAHQDTGTMTPTGALSSFPYTPEESMVALKNYYRNYGSLIWGEYGFRDAFNLGDNWVSPLFMGLNQAPIVVMIENYRTGLIWNLFMSHPDVQVGLEKLNKIK